MSPTTINTDISTLNVIFTWMVNNDHLDPIHKPVIQRIISPVSSTFVAEAILYRDSCLASHKKMFQDDFRQLNFFTNLLTQDNHETKEDNLDF